jgi:hypothetical protein
MMDRSLTGADLRRDPRCSLHSASADKNVADGDAKVTGRAREVTDEETLARFRAAFAAANGYGPPPGPMDLFRLDVVGLAFVTVENDELVIRSWTEAGGERRVART